MFNFDSIVISVKMVSSFSELSTPKLKKLLLDQGRSPRGKRSELIARLNTPISYEPVQMIFFVTGASLFGQNQSGIYFLPSLKQEIGAILAKNNVRHKAFLSCSSRLFFDTALPVEEINKLFPGYTSTTWIDYDNDFVDPDLILRE